MLLLALVILGVLSTPLSVSSAKQPNIVFILADDLGYADIGYHGGAGQIKTPVLDQLAYDGVRLENYYVQPVCTPTRGALLAGKVDFITYNVCFCGAVVFRAKSFNA